MPITNRLVMTNYFLSLKKIITIYSLYPKLANTFLLGIEFERKCLIVKWIKNKVKKINEK